MKQIILYLGLFFVPIFGVAQPTSFLVLDGTESINIPKTDNINDYFTTERTLEMWFKVDDASSFLNPQVIFEGGGRINGFNIFILNDKIHLGAWSEGNTPEWFGSWFRKPISSNVWYHIALVLDQPNSELKWYLNGDLQHTITGYAVQKHGGDLYLNSSGKTVFPDFPNVTWLNGANGEYFEATTEQVDGLGDKTDTDEYIGAIGLLRIWNSVRTQTQIQDNKTTIYTTSDLNNASDYLVAFLNGDYFEYVENGGTNAVTDGGGEGNAGAVMNNFMQPGCNATYYVAPNTSISSSGTPTVTTTITVPDNFTITDLIVTIDVSHTWDEDLDIFLISPSETQVELTTGNGSSGDDYRITIFDDAAATEVTSGSAPFDGTYSPEGDLSSFDGESAKGDWILKINDTANNDGGTINSIELNFCYSPFTCVWYGSVDNDWSNVNNWKSSAVPGDGDNVSIAVENTGSHVDPILPTDIYYYNNFEVSSASTFDAGASSKFNITGYFSNSGTVTTSGGSIICNSYFSNSGTVTMSSSSITCSSYVQNLGTFTINNDGKIIIPSGSNGGIANQSGGIFNFNSGEIINGGEYDISGTLYSFINWDATSTFTFGVNAKYTGVSTGVFDNQGIVVVKSDATGTGSLITNGTVTNSGTMTVERWIDTYKTWQLVSSPMEAEKANTFYGHFLNSYDEDQGDFNHIKNKDTPLVVGDGYVAKRDGVLAGHVPNPHLFNLSKPNTGDVTVNLIRNTWSSNADGSIITDDGTNWEGFSNTGLDLVDGFNLVGNPYPSSIDWATVYDANSGVLNAAYYRYYNVDGGDAGTWTATLNSDTDVDKRTINIGQGFVVVLTANANNTMTIPNSARIHNHGNGFGKKNHTSSTPISFIMVASSNGLSDNIDFRLNEEATSAYDGKYDAYKFNSFGDTPTPYFVSSDDKRLSICQQPESESVDLGFNMATSGEVTFSLSDVNDFTEITLEDKETGDFVNLITDTYTFTYSDEDTETGRFTLFFNKGALNEIEQLDNLSVYSNESTLYLKSDKRLNDVSVSIYNISGQEVLSKHFEALTNKEINTGLQGVYILKLSSDKGNYTTKLILN